MNFNIDTNYSFWFILCCILIGISYSALLYYKSNTLKELPKPIKITLAMLRFFMVFFLAFLLLSPHIKTINRTIEKPIIIIAQDNSESIILNKDSSFYKGNYKKNVTQLIKALSKKYNVQAYAFGDKITNTTHYTFNEKETDISTLFSELETRYSNRNVGAVIIASDGLYNKGSNPLYASLKLKAPIYTIAMGDTAAKKDICLTKVEHNELAYLGNSFPLEVKIAAQQLNGTNTTLRVLKGKQILFTQKIDINSANFQLTLPVQLEATETGLQHYRIQLSTVKNEANLKNNAQDIFIEVLNSKEKVLILADAPHPDVAAIKQAIEGNKNYEVESALFNDFSKPIKGYNLIVLHQIPSQNNTGKPLLKEIETAKIPLLYIITTRSAINSLNAAQIGLNISETANKPNEAEPIIANNFSLFTLSDDLRKNLEKLPALQTPFGIYTSSNAVNTLFYQQIGTVATQNPLFLFNANNEKKIGIIVGEGLWKWRFQDYAVHNNHNLFNELINKTVQYLSGKENKSFFRIKSKNNFFENEAIELDAEVYNNSYELINTAEVNITVSNNANKKFRFTFNKTFNAYHLNAGKLPIGEYKYEASVKIGEKILTQKGVFSINPLIVESINTRADYQILYTLAQKYGGEMLNANELNKLTELLNNREDIKSVSYSENKLTAIINLPWIFFLLISLLTLEWLIRKRNGGY